MFYIQSSINQVSGNEGKVQLLLVHSDQDLQEGKMAEGDGGTHWKDLDIKSMKVAELKAELDAR